MLGPQGADGLAVDRDSNVYVADTWNHRIEKYSSSGALLAVWTRPGSLPVSVAVGPQGSIFLSDEATSQIVKLSPQGRTVATWSNLHAGKYWGLTPNVLTVGADGTVYVDLIGMTGGCKGKLCWDDALSYLQAYTPDGRPGVTFPDAGCQLPFGVPTCAIAVDRQGVIMVAGDGRPQIDRYTRTGRRLTPWAANTNLKLLSTANGLALDARGGMYITSGPFNELDELSRSGQLLNSLATAGAQPGRFMQPTGIAVSPAGTLAVVDSENERIQELSSTNGGVMGHWPVDMDRMNGTEASTIAFDGRGNVYRIAYNTEHPPCGDYGCSAPGSIVRSSPSGRILARWTPRLAPAFQPIGLASGPHGTLYVVDALNRVVVLSSTGRVLAQWTTAPDGKVTGGIAVGPRGGAYVVEGPGYSVPRMRIEVLVNGWRRALWRGLPVLGGVAVGPSGHLFATEPDRDRVVRFSLSGQILTQWGSAGSEVGQFHSPMGIAVDRYGDVYVTDKLNDRIQRFSAAAPSQP
jgi:sugar lactone lactonase YvrE